jgi:carbamoyltransferase
MEILAIGGFFHDLNFSYLDTADYTSLLSIEEERFSRKKSHSCLNQVSSTLKGWEYICSKRSDAAKKIDIMLLSDKVDQPIYEFLLEQINPSTVLRIGHHKCHAANVLFFNRNICENSKIFVFDAFGDGYSGAIFHNPAKLDENVPIEADNSVGLLYTAATRHLGLGSFGSEGKMQGLAPYGSYTEKYSIKEFLTVQDHKPLVDRALALTKYGPNQEMYASSIGLDIDYYHQLIPSRYAGEELTQNHSDFAFTIQRDIFDLLSSVVEANLQKATNELTAIGIGGGLGQNSSLIAYLNDQFQDFHFVTSTSCSDRGNSLGALYSYLGAQSKLNSRTHTPFLGYDADEISLTSLRSFKLISYGENSLFNAASKLSQNELVCTFISRSEYGARALGNRSILANPSQSSTRDYLNMNVKHRELYRPFAAILLPEEAPHFLCTQKEYPIWMTECVKVNDTFIESNPSAAHVDGTCRVQIAEEGLISPLIRKLLKILFSEFRVASIINTSLNDAGEPIVNGHHDLIKTMKSTGIKYVLTSDGLYELEKDSDY